MLNAVKHLNVEVLRPPAASSRMTRMESRAIREERDSPAPRLRLTFPCPALTISSAFPGRLKAGPYTDRELPTAGRCRCPKKKDF